MRLIIAGAAGDVWVRLEPETSSEIVALEQSVAQGHWTIGRGSEAITKLRVLADHLGYPVRVTEEREPSEVPPPRLVVVQRGETELAERLRVIARPGVPVIWDRRERERRTANRPTSQDRRSPPPRHVGQLALSHRASDGAAALTLIWLDATGRPRPTHACWTCGREVAPMRFRACDLPPHGEAPPQTC